VTQPLPAPPAEQRPADETTRPARVRAGAVVAYRVEDLVYGGELAGFAVVLKVNGDQVDLAPIGGELLQVSVDALSAATAGDVPNTLPAPVVEDSTSS
jgi:hypothetical protein